MYVHVFVYYADTIKCHAHKHTEKSVVCWNGKTDSYGIVSYAYIYDSEKDRNKYAKYSTRKI